jgi:hypothetical protein
MNTNPFNTDRRLDALESFWKLLKFGKHLWPPEIFVKEGLGRISKDMTS